VDGPIAVLNTVDEDVLTQVSWELFYNVRSDVRLFQGEELVHTQTPFDDSLLAQVEVLLHTRVREVL